MSRGYQKPQPEAEIARRLANLERQMERLVRMPPTAPTEVTDALTDLDASVADLDGHTHGLNSHTHTLVNVQVTYNASGNITHVNGVPISGAGSFNTNASATDGPTPTDTAAWTAP